MILDGDQSLLEVAQETADVADHEDVERAFAGRGQHGLPGRSAPGRCPARRCHRPLEPGVDPPAARDAAILLLALSVGTEIVPRAGGRLAKRAGNPQAGDMVERERQGAFHGAGSFGMRSVSTLPLARCTSTSRRATTRARTTGLVE